MFLQTVHGTIGRLLGDLASFSPEVALSIGIVALLVLRFFRALNRLHLGLVALGVVALAIGLTWTQWISDPTIQVSGAKIEEVGTAFKDQQEAFGRLVVFDTYTVFFRLFLLGATALVIWLTLLTGIPDQEDSADFHTLLLGACLGMMMMASANHLLMVYIAVEMASLPSYAMAGFLKGKRRSSEAALKYVVYGGAASGVMLYGISLLAGRFGTAYLPEVANGFVKALEASATGGAAAVDPILVTGLLMVLIGLAFKLSAVPFHFWCPDVFEGAAAEVAGFLSVASKGAAIALVGRFTLVLAGGVPTMPELTPEQWRLMAAYLGPALALFAAITATFGNLAAYAQTNMKRLLAYSTIAHAGYMLMAVSTLTREGMDAALIYLVAYVFMNLGAFAVVAFIRNQTGCEEVSDYRGLMYRAPLLSIALTIFFLSLVGLPPLVGFAAKYQVFAAMYSTATTYQNNGLLVLLVIGLLNTVVSLVYYVRVMRIMIIESPTEEAADQPLRLTPMQSIYVGLLTLVVTFGIFAWDPVADGSRKGVEQFRQVAPPGGPTASTK